MGRLRTISLAVAAPVNFSLPAEWKWTRHAGLNCLSKGEDLEVPEGSSAGILSLEDCQQECIDMAGCDGVVRDVLNLTWDVQPNTNCYEGHGATDLADGIGSAEDCQIMTENECRTQCVLTPGCTGVAYSVEYGGYCCLRADIFLPKCDTGPGWDTHVLADIQPGAGNCYRRGNVSVALCDAQSEDFDTFLLGEYAAAGAAPWWLTTHFAERAFMPRHFSCSGSLNSTCTFSEIKDMLPEVQAQGYSVINVDWPIESGPDPLCESPSSPNRQAPLVFTSSLSCTSFAPPPRDSHLAHCCASRRRLRS